MHRLSAPGQSCAVRYWHSAIVIASPCRGTPSSLERDSVIGEPRVPPFLRHARIATSRRSVAVAYFLAFLGLGVVLPYFPLYLDHLGYAGWQIGAIVGLQPVLRWTSALGWAHVADRWRVRRRLLVLAGLGGALVVLPLLAVRRFAAVAAVSTALRLVHGPIIPTLDAPVT